MVLRARKGGSLVISLRLTLRPGRDDDLIALVSQAPRGALAGLIRDAMRSGVRSGAEAFEVRPEEVPLDMSGLGLEV